MSRAGLILEGLLLFVALPLAYRYAPIRLPALPVLWAVAGYAWWTLRRDPTFPQTRLWNPAPLAANLLAILATFAVVAGVLWLAARWFAPQLLWSFVRNSPRLWAVVMVAYPALSVYPQGVLYRAFFCHRYAVLFAAQGRFGNWPLILASAAAFGFLHIIFRNPLAVGLTFLGGILFAQRYLATNSLATSSLEHALYGCWLFTLGLGRYFYHGTIATVASAGGKRMRQ